MCENNSRIHLDRLYSRVIAKELNIPPVLDKIQACRRNWLQHANIMSCNITEVNKKTKDRKAEGTRGDC
jgi:hypothetical protein